MHLVVDPVLLRAPAAGAENLWIETMSNLGGLVAEGPWITSCPAELRDAALAAWFQGPGDESSPPVTRHDLLRVLQEITGRLSGDITPPEGAVLLDRVKVDPEYVQPKLLPAEREGFIEHLGDASVAKQDGAELVDVLSDSTSWSKASDSVLIEAEILVRDHPLHGECEPGAESASVHTHLHLSTEVSDVLTHLCDHPCRLISDHLELGVRATWVGKFDGALADIEFEIGPRFAESIRALNYAHDPRYAAACLRAMAMIAGGRTADVPGHPERVGRGAGNPIVCDAKGNPVQRSYLAQQSPNAHRLFWVRARAPRFLNVSGHEGGPTLSEQAKRQSRIIG